MHNQKDFIELEKARSVIFNIYSALFCQPDKAVIGDVNIFKRLEQASQFCYPNSSNQVKELKSAADSFSDTELLIEYARLFIGPFKTFAPPYSSVYLGSKNTVYSEETIWVMQFYKKTGLDFDRDIHDLPDHIAVEFEFIYYMIYNEVSQFEENNIEKAKFYHTSQSEFANEHLRKWVPLFCAKIIEETKNGYYQFLAESLHSLIEVDMAPEFP